MINLRFTSDTLPNDTFQVLQLEGEEQISRLFRFELRLVSRDPDIDFKTALEGQASLAITTQGEIRYVHGMLSEFEQGAAWHSGLYEYRAVMVPRLWMMTRSVQNQIYQKQTVPDIVQGELDNIQSKGEHPLVMNGLGSADYEIHTVGNYDEREYVVQYKETDFNFISRLMEHEGIYYYFDHDESAEKLVVTDILAAQESTDRAPVQFQADAASTNYAKDIVYKLSRSQKQIPGSVLLKDYNYQSPSLPLQAMEVVATDGIGFVTEYGSNFKTPEEGEKLSTIRAEEFRCQQNIYSGESHVGRFCCGHIYSLTNHFREEYNQDYLMIKVVHHASQAIESWGKVGGTSYHNEFSCIPADLQYRPQRLTPKPKLYGIMNGVIDSEQDMGRADIDEEGRYKVLMPFDISGAAPGKASRRIRMAQPYGGGGSGMSFPLIKGTEVIWTCIDGDIDRPIITGAVPNTLNPSVTTTTNNTSNVIKTTSGITMGFHDGSGNGSGSSASSSDGLVGQQQNQHINPSVSWTSNSQNGAFQNSNVHIADNVTQSIQQQQQMVGGSTDNYTTGELNLSSIETHALNEHYAGGGKNFTIGVPDFDDSPGASAAGHRDCYLRLGKTPAWELSWGEPWHNDGWLDFTDGDHVSMAKGDRVSITDGDYTDITAGTYTQIKGNPTDPAKWEKIWKKGLFWRTVSASWSSKASFSFGDAESLWGGIKLDASVGHSTSLKLASSLSATMAADVAVKGGVSYAWGTQTSQTAVTRSDTTVETHQITAGGRIKLNVKTPDGAQAAQSTSGAALGVGAVGAAVGAAVATANALASGSTVADGLVTGACHTAAAGVYGALLAKGIAENSARRVEGTESVELDMVGAGPALGNIRLGMGSGPTSPAMPGIDISPGMITIGFGSLNEIKITPAGITLATPLLKLEGITTIVGNPTLTTKLDVNGANVGITAKTEMKMAAPNVKGIAGILTL